MLYPQTNEKTRNKHPVQVVRKATTSGGDRREAAFVRQPPGRREGGGQARASARCHEGRFPFNNTSSFTHKAVCTECPRLIVTLLRECRACSDVAAWTPCRRAYLPADGEGGSWSGLVASVCVWGGRHASQKGRLVLPARALWLVPFAYIHKDCDNYVQEKTKEAAYVGEPTTP